MVFSGVPLKRLRAKKEKKKEKPSTVGRNKSKSQLLVPGMSQYCDSQDIDMDAGTAQDPGSLSFSTSVASQKKVPQEFDISSEASENEESITNFG